jgi:flagellar basal-body rod modification protein FlgD
MSTGNVASTGTSSTGLDASTTAALNSLGSVNISQFLQMMLAEMQNQDPLNPMSNTDLMNQIGDMQQISASNQLTTTLQAMQVGQALSNATALIGATVSGTDSTGAAASGVVSQVTISNGTPSLQIGTQTVPLANVTGVLAPASGSGSSAASTLAALEQALSSGGTAAANAATNAAATVANAAGSAAGTTPS